jgi:hypothetical protein
MYIHVARYTFSSAANKYSIRWVRGRRVCGPPAL